MFPEVHSTADAKNLKQKVMTALPIAAAARINSGIGFLIQNVKGL
jgi:hypothetical protein